MQSNREIAAYTIEALKKAGAQGAECMVTQGRADELNVDGGEFSLLRTLFTSGIAMKAIKDGKKGTAAVNKLDKDTIDQAVADCITAAESGMADDSEFIAPDGGKHAFSGGPLEADRDRLFDRIQEFMGDIKREYPKVLMEQLISKHKTSDLLYMNSNGSEYAYQKGSYDLSAMFSTHEGDKASSFNGYGMVLRDLDKPFLDLGMFREIFANSEKELEAQSIEGKFTGTVLISPACLMEILGEILGITVSDGQLINGTSVWKDKLGQQVAGEALTVRSVPLSEDIVGGERFTGDGHISEDYSIIENGLLKSFMLTQYGAKKTGNDRAKNGASNIEILPGDKSMDEILSGIGKGLVLGRFSGGMPSVNGDFSGVAKNSFLIEDGKIGQALSETMISGNLLEMLKNIVGISKERVLDGASILPWIAFDGVVISGK